MAYREFESAQSLLREQQAAQRLSAHWHGRIVPAEQYESFDRRLLNDDGTTAALVEIKWRNYPIEFMVDHGYLLSMSKVKSLRAQAKQRRCVPLVMVVLSDADFLLDLRDETSQSVRRLPMNDRYYDERTGETLMRDEWLICFSVSRFIPIVALPSLL
ncbi:MAG: hypothetical protein EBT82_05660 [Micrococcales bacterium]|nr:hypothetical protein [Micrococcales bacterium]NBR87681.1 hypothetical protein [Verrucomicrobiota bacterium]NBU11544.1 hypothetical protein [Pseudomonadota bacterium]NDE96847.1 hypothetical protein [Verrucomicrobiota bacterium]